MNCLSFSLAKQIIPLFIIIVAGVSTLYGQETPLKTEPSTNVAQTNQERSRFALSAGETPAVPVKRLTLVRRTDGVQTDPRFALSAGETPAVPEKRLTPLMQTDGVQTDPCFGPRAGEIAALPLKGLRLDLDRVTGFGRDVDAVDANAQPAAQTTTQTTSDPYVFPTREERAKRYAKSMFGPSALLRSAASAGINQWQDSPEEWEQGMSGYGKRFASSFGRNAIQQTVIYGLDSALGWDTGFRRSPSKEFGARLKHALLENITSRKRSGKRVISVPRLTGVYISGVISREAWYPERYDYKDGLRSGTNSLLIGFALNVVREFVVKF